MQEESWELSVCPSFNSYSSDKLVDVAANVTREFDHDDEEAFEFEFVSVRKAEDELVVLDGQIGPVFPVFNRDLLLSDQNPTKSQQITDGQDLKNREGEEEEDEDVRRLRIPLKKLFSEEHDPTSYSSSSSEVDELEGVPPGTYCVWTPHINSSPKAIAAAVSPSQCKKSNSTGTTTSSNTKSSSCSKRWRLMNLLRRSNSEGKDSFVFLTPKNKEEEISNGNNSFEEENSISNSKEMKKVVVVKRKKKKEKEQTVSSAHEMFYGRKRESMERDRRKTYLPYRKDLVGFWASVGSLGRTFPPF